jgi:hypothetical protein
MKTIFGVALVIASFLISVSATQAADASVGYGAPYLRAERTDCPIIESCVRGECYARRVCYRGCSDRYSCYPLYGAYGPYGGIGYWGAYTDTGWGYRR